MFLYFKEGWISMISIRLQKDEPVYNKKQDAIIIDQRSNQQIQRCKILEQIRLYLRIQ